jgi:AcrR family transcriptional regulator
MNIHSAQGKHMPPRTDKRQAILDAALMLFAERGFHGTSVPEIAKSAGVGAGTIYRHFESKEALVNALYQHWKALSGVALLAQVPTDVPWRTRFRALWNALMAFDADNPMVLDFLDLQHHTDYLDETSRQLELLSASSYFAFIQAAQADEAIMDDPPGVIAALVFGAYLGLVRGARSGYYPLSPDIVLCTEERVWSMIRR